MGGEVVDMVEDMDQLTWITVNINYHMWSIHLVVRGQRASGGQRAQPFGSASLMGVALNVQWNIDWIRWPFIGCVICYVI